MKPSHWYIIIIGAVVLWYVLNSTKANGGNRSQTTNPDDPRNLLDWSKPFPWLKDIPSPADIITNLESLVEGSNKEQKLLEDMLKKS